jgi:3-oxoacyl-[acyl-carrier protein] reductase
VSASTLPLDGRVALVTGAARGLGAEIARSLAGAGATVAVNYLQSRGPAERLAEEIGGGAFQADVQRADEALALAAAVTERLGRVDILISNAGIWHGGRIDTVGPAQWQEVISTSLGGAFNVAAAVVPGMRHQHYGRIVFMSSVIGLVGFAGDSAYASAKAGLFGLTRSLAKEAGRDGVTVNAVAPGPIQTDMTAQVGDAAWERMRARMPLARAGNSDDVAQAVRYLVCDAPWVTGQVLVVDGGFSL